MNKPLYRIRLFVLIFCLLSFTFSFAQVTGNQVEVLNTNQTAIAVASLYSSVYDKNDTQKEGMETIAIKILSGTGDIAIAKQMAKHLNFLGYDITTLDVAPRSNFTNNTIYFADTAKGQAEALAAELENTGPILKPLSWSSQFDVILVAVKIPKKKPVVSSAKAPELKIKILSGDGNISTAKSISNQLKQIGYKNISVDYAPRSNFRANAIYYTQNAKPRADQMADLFEDRPLELRPLTWKSKYDLIVVTVSPERMEEVKISREAQIRQGKKDAIIGLNDEAAAIISEAHGFFLQKNYEVAGKKFDSAVSRLNTIEDRCKKASGVESKKSDAILLEKPSREMDYKDIKIQVLSKNVDLGPAKKTAKKIKKMGLDVQPVDYALRSDLTNNTLYFHPSYEKLAGEIAFALEDEPYLKPIRWYSTYDLILVTGEPAAHGRASWLLEKWRKEEENLKKEMDNLLTEAKSLIEKEDFIDAGSKYSEAAGLAERAVNIAQKSIQQTQKLAMEETLGPLKMVDMSETMMLSLNEAIKIAVANNATIKEAEEKLNSAIEEKKSARAGFFPKGSAEYTYTKLNEPPSASLILEDGTPINFTSGYEETYKWNASLTQPLFTGFALVSQYQMKELGVKIAEVEKEMTTMNLVRDVKKAYFNLLLAKAAVKVAGEAVKNLESHEKDAEQYYKQGMIPYNDLLKSKVALAHVVQQREKALSAQKITTSALNTLLDFDINRKIDVQGLKTIPPVSFKLADLLHEALENRPELKMMHLAIKSIDKGIRLVKSAYYPKLAMIGYYSQTGDNLKATENDYGAIYNHALILKAQWDFFEGGKTRADVAKYQYDKKALMKQYEYAENGIQLEVKKAFSDLQVSDKNIITSQKSLTQAKENWRITDLQYKEQIATSTDVLDARTELTQAESNYYSALYGYMIALADLERAVGRKYVNFEESAAFEK